MPMSLTSKATNTRITVPYPNPLSRQYLKSLRYTLSLLRYDLSTLSNKDNANKSRTKPCLA